MTAKVRRTYRTVNGVFLLDKPEGIGSNSALRQLQRIYLARKAGHTGTLDPLASGLLVICLGHATKFAGEMLLARKTYIAEITLGIRTSTADREGEVIARAEALVDRASLEAALTNFRGEIQQIPPMYSALKRDGIPLYQYARKGITLDRPPRKVCIYRLEVLKFAPPKVELLVECSKGTYVRSIADDLGLTLGCGAHLSGLRRTELGSFLLSDARTLDSLSNLLPEELDRFLIPVDTLLGHYPEYFLDPAASEKFLQGQKTTIGTGTVGYCRVYAEKSPGSGEFLGLGERDAMGMLHPRRVMSDGDVGESAPVAVIAKGS